MKRIILILAGLMAVSVVGYSQQSDTIIISLAKTSKIVFTIDDRDDIEILKHYNFQELFRDVLDKLEKNDTTALLKDNEDIEIVIDENDEVVSPDETDEEVTADRDEDTDDDYNADHDDDDYNQDDDWDINIGSRRWGRTWQSFNFDLGTNNYLENGKFPDADNELYSVRPWGSWYLAIASVQRSRIAKKLFLEWSLGMSWYNFKFQNDDILISKGDDGVTFTRDTREDVDFIKSKLSASYLYASLIPVVDFGDRTQKHRFWNHHGNSFRIGIGPYIAYRVGSHSKLVYNDGGREKDKDRDNFYLNNFRYGGRLQLGYRSTDVFFNYDISELFSEGKGPDLNAFSFGVIF
ncbi:MAG TPA: hypothetical protein VD884_07650 [Ohtaekwangia sp.]|nr:hypothetical protein [Ohtaekwangia sp.]